jgi:hypothetical protein
MDGWVPKKTIKEGIYVRILLSLFVLFAVVFSLGLSVKADEICDGLEGAAFGLCNAYCKACGCDGEPAPSTKKCEKLQANYEKIIGELPPYDPCFNVACSDGEMCVDGECICGDRACTEFEDCEAGLCIDPCADLAAVEECPCNYLAEMPIDNCWGPGSPFYFFGPRFISESGLPVSSCGVFTFMRRSIPGGTAEGTRAIAVTQLDGPGGSIMECGWGVPSLFNEPECFVPQEFISITEAEYNTCKCRVEQFATKMEAETDLPILPSGPYMCD